MIDDLRTSLFNINLSTETPESGKLLVAEPFLKENHFNHAVILLIDHAAEFTSMGLVLNRRTNLRLSDVTDDAGKGDLPIFSGGPVGDDRMFYLHTLGGLFKGSIEVSPGLYIGGDYGQVTDYIRAGYPTEGLLRFYVGYSGWEPGQLEEEIGKNVWAVTSAGDAGSLLTGAEDSFWHRVVRSMGDRYRGWLFHPMEPWAN